MTRDRGSYGPGDPDRNWILRWGADQTADYVRDQTVGAALRPAMPFISEAYRAKRGVKRVWTASQGIGGRDEAEKSPTQIGQELFHTAGDRDRAIVHLSTGFRALASDLAVWQTSNTTNPAASKIAQWIAADVTPALEEWKAFVVREQKSWWTKIATSWETFEGWWDRLKQLRSLARAHGALLHSSDLQPLPKTIWQHSCDGTGSEATAILGVLKIGALTVLGVMGFAGLFSVIRNANARLHADDHKALKKMVHAELKHLGH